MPYQAVNKLQDKHPHHITNHQVPEKLDNVQKDLTSAISLKRSFSAAINKAPRGSGVGPSGWRYEHLRVLMCNVITNDSLYLMSSLIAEGKVPSSVLPLLTAARLIALPKSNADIRPIAIGEVIPSKSHSKSCMSPDEHCFLQLLPSNSTWYSHTWFQFRIERSPTLSMQTCIP